MDTSYLVSIGFYQLPLPSSEPAFHFIKLFSIEILVLNHLIRIRIRIRIHIYLFLQGDNHYGQFYVLI